jgi:hypothetical protein
LVINGDRRNTGGEYFLQARLNVSLPGVEREVAQALVDAAHQTLFQGHTGEHQRRDQCGVSRTNGLERNQ